MIRGFLSWLAEHKVVTLLSVVLFSFVIATIAVAVEKSNMQDDLDVCYQKLTEATRTTEAAEPTTESTTDSTTEPTKDPEFYRLPTGMIPVNYKIRLHPDLEKNTFQGHMEILATASTALDELVLHSYGLTIEKITLTTGETSVAVTFDLSNDDRELLTITPESQLQAGDYNIDIEYSGRLDGIIGFYASTVDEDKFISSLEGRECFPSPMESLNTARIVQTTPPLTMVKRKFKHMFMAEVAGVTPLYKKRVRNSRKNMFGK